MALPQDVTFVRIAGKDSPGIVKFTTPPQRAYTFDTKKQRGGKGPYYVSTGEDAPEFSMRFELYDEDEYNAWVEFAKPLDASSRDEPLAIEHPLLAEREITAIVIVNVGAAVEEIPGGPNVAIVKVRKFISVPPAPRVTRKKKGKTKDPEEPILTEQQKEIARLVQQEKDTGRGL